MKIEDFRKFEYNCRDTQELLTLLLLCPEELTFDEQDEVEKHLAGCDSCRQDYQGMKQVSDILFANQDYLRKNAVFGNTQTDRVSTEMSHEEIMNQRFQDRMERVLVRRKRRERKGRIARFKRLAKPLSAIAACLVIGVGAFFGVSQLKTVKNGSSPVASNQQQNPVKIEVISEDGTAIVPIGQVITALDGLKNLRINNNRQMVLNVGTQLSVAPYNLGCVVKLDKGEIYTEVEHDGKPFIVETSHGRAVITGTIFNIKTNQDKMELSVIEGSVRFESEKGPVDVTGGFQSSIAASMRPTKPAVCDVIQISKWAKKHDIESALFDIPANTYISELAELPLAHVPYCDLEDINFEVWIDQHRAWFEREFPWTKRLQILLAQDSIEVDTIHLLIESGDLWRFAWPEHSRQRLLAEEQIIIKKIAKQYGVESDRLTSVVFMSSVKEDPNIEAFEKWLDAFEQGKNDLIIDSIHAATFLVNTRSLAWYAIESDKIQVQQKQQVLNLLEKQVKISSGSVEMFNQLLLADKNESVCSEAQYEGYIKKVKEDISSMMEIERKLADHANHSRK